MSPSQAPTSFPIRSADGVELRVWVEGSGPPMVLVHGSFTDHTAWEIPIGELRGRFTTYAMDRRGFGASGDGSEYSIEREFEDVAAVVEGVADRAGQSVVLWGHSYGANCVMGGASLTSQVSHLILYEPSFGLAYPPGAVEEAEEALEAGDRETAVTRMLIDILQLTTEEVDGLRDSPRWPLILAGAHTTPRECRVEHGWEYRQGQFEGITAPTLLLSGSESTASVRAATDRAAAAIPDARIHVLEGHAHFAHRTAPALVVSVIVNFIAAGPGPGG